MHGGPRPTECSERARSGASARHATAPRSVNDRAERQGMLARLRPSATLDSNTGRRVLHIGGVAHSTSGLARSSFAARAERLTGDGRVTRPASRLRGQTFSWVDRRPAPPAVERASPEPRRWVHLLWSMRRRAQATTRPPRRMGHERAPGSALASHAILRGPTGRTRVLRTSRRRRARTRSCPVEGTRNVGVTFVRREVCANSHPSPRAAARTAIPSRRGWSPRDSGKCRSQSMLPIDWCASWARKC